MRPRALAALLGLATLTSAACGKTKEEERVDFVRDTCRAFVPGTTLYRDTFIAFGGGEFTNRVCGGTLTPEGTDDVCDYGQSVCQQDYVFIARDDRACTTGPGGGCIYGCVVRMSQADLDANSDTVKICSRFFYGPQPCPAVRPNPICG